MMTHISVEFCVLTDPDEEGETWTPIAQLSPAAGLALWDREHLSCCTLQAGFRVSIDGEIWNASALDEISMAGTWLSATAALLRGSTRASVWAWEESNMTLSRRGALIDALDVHHGGTVICPLVTMPLADFSLALAAAARAGAAWLAELSALALAPAPKLAALITEQLGGSDWQQAADELRTLAAAPIQAPPPHDPGPLPEPWLAAMSRDHQRLLAGLHTHSAGLLVDGKPLLHLCVQYAWLEGVQAVLEAGAEVTQLDQGGFTPLQQAARRTFGRGDPVVDHLLRAGARIDPMSACLMDRPDALLTCSAEGIVLPETLNWWTMCMVSDNRPLTPQWETAVKAAIAAGTPVEGVEGGLGGWYESPIETARAGERSELVALLAGAL